MIPLTPEQRAYKEKTIEQLLANFALLEAQAAEETRTDVVEDINDQLEAIQTHIGHLQGELATNAAGEAIADDLYRQIATALTNGKFHLARKLINKLETIEPFYPTVDRMRSEVENKKASRRTQSVARGGRLPEIVLSPELIEAAAEEMPQGVIVPNQPVVAPAPQGFFGRLFQFHIVVSCLAVALIGCAMFGVGGVMAMQWIFTGN